jgi:clathrin heavy chain
METAAQSKKQSVAEDLLQFFVEKGLKDCFAACLYNCYNLIRPDVAMELSWRHKIQDMSMPFLIQVVREYTSKVDELYKIQKDSEAQAKELEEQKKKALESVDSYGMDANAYSYVPSYIPTQTIVAPMGYSPYGSTIPQQQQMPTQYSPMQDMNQGGGSFF